MGILRDSELDVVAELGRTKLQLQDIYFLHPGDVIDLGQPATGTIQLYVGNAPWFSGKIGTQNKNMAVKIMETYDNQGRREQ